MCKDFFDKWAISLLGISSIVLLFIILTLCVSKFIVSPKPQSIRVEWKIVPADSTILNSKTVNPALLDSIQHVLSLHEQRVNEKVDYLIDKKEQEEDARTAVVVIVGFCISVFAFFGYKSFKDIKKDAVEIAENVAKKETVGTIQSNLSQEIDRKFQDIYNETMRQTIQKEINERIPETLKAQVWEYMDSLYMEFHKREKSSNEPNQSPEQFFE